ncbi:MAG: HIT domain-containing protein [Verrucomicrobiota bacterium]
MSCGATQEHAAQGRAWGWPAGSWRGWRGTIGWHFETGATSVGGMESLHAPWRIEYILAPKPPRSDLSLFTRIGQSDEDEANHVVVRERTCFAVLNTYPYTGGHLLVVPYKQAADLTDLTDEELCDLMKLTRRCQRVLTKTMKPDGFNIGLNLGKAAGAGIAEHLHIHIVPRWTGDTNFMPVVANTAVLPDALLHLAAKLRAAFAAETDS